jgi:phosphoribosyl 1,2-cyclic phosphodiesterase
VDAGLSCRELLRRMVASGEDPAQLDAILLTHEHIDHVAGMPVLARKLGIPVYCTEPTHRAWVRMMTPRTIMSYAQWLDLLQQQKQARAEAAAEKFAPAGAQPAALRPEPVKKTTPAAQAAVDESMQAPVEAEDCEPEVAARAKADPTYLPRVEFFQPGKGFTIGDLCVSAFTTPHDAADPCGFVFEADGVRMAVATDLGYIPPNVKAALRSVDVLLLESNHDLEMLRDGPYPWSVKQRVLSRVGHLSNDATAQFLERDYDGGAVWIVLGHISESNNAPELARLAAERALNNRMSLLGNRVLIAQQSEPMQALQL